MGFFEKFSQRRPARPPASAHDTEASGGGGSAAAPDRRDEPGLKNAIARGAAEGSARETLRALFTRLLDE